MRSLTDRMLDLMPLPSVGNVKKKSRFTRFLLTIGIGFRILQWRQSDAQGERVMKIRIGQLEILDATPEEIDQLIERYGGCLADTTESTGSSEIKPRRNGQTSYSTTDRVVLERLVNAGNDGAPTQEVGDVLGRRGKSTRRGLIEWAKRLGIVQDDAIDPFEDCRAGTKRGVRLKQSFLPVAQALLKG